MRSVLLLLAVAAAPRVIVMEVGDPQLGEPLRALGVAPVPSTSDTALRFGDCETAACRLAITRGTNAVSATISRDGDFQVAEILWVDGPTGNQQQVFACAGGGKPIVPLIAQAIAALATGDKAAESQDCEAWRKTVPAVPRAVPDAEGHVKAWQAARKTGTGPIPSRPDLATVRKDLALVQHYAEALNERAGRTRGKEATRVQVELKHLRELIAELSAIESAQLEANRPSDRGQVVK